MSGATKAVLMLRQAQREELAQHEGLAQIVTLSLSKGEAVRDMLRQARQGGLVQILILSLSKGEARP